MYNAYKLEQGRRFKNNQGSWATLIMAVSKRDVLMKFDSGYEAIFNFSNVSVGSFKDLLFPFVAGVGYPGVGSYKCYSNGHTNKSYSDWREMLKRCYNKKALIKMPAYLGCYVCDEWFNYQNFARWRESQPNHSIWQLDKDIINIGNKEYSPKNCCFLPLELNVLLTDHRAKRGNNKQGVFFDGSKYISKVNIDSKTKYLGYFNTEDEAFAVYKAAKEENVKRMAEKYKGRIDNRAYESLMNYSL
ncbi:MAG: hypothetical protein LLF95_12295 [Bacteroidales bacterium]|nr:hypothetical protein [Bacteroidales bacterium]